MSEKVGKLTAEQMLAEIDKHAPGPQPDPDDGSKTLSEWADFWGFSTSKAGKVIKRCVAQKIMKPVSRRRAMSNGNVRSTSCYLWVGKEKPRLN